jgi:hypothetical protein
MAIADTSRGDASVVFCWRQGLMFLEASSVRIGALWSGHGPGTLAYLAWLLNVIVNRNSTTLSNHMGC